MYIIDQQIFCVNYVLVQNFEVHWLLLTGVDHHTFDRFYVQWMLKSVFYAVYIRFLF